jgi:hypothetical protein
VPRHLPEPSDGVLRPSRRGGRGGANSELLGCVAQELEPYLSDASALRLDQPNERADDAMKQGTELRVDGPDEAHGLGGFQAGERFPR